MIWLDLIDGGACEDDWYEFEWDGGLDRRSRRRP